MADLLRELEQGYEAKFKLDQEQHFKAECRRNKLLGRWAAERMGLSPAESDAYARSMVTLALDRAGFEPILSRISDDLGRHGTPIERIALLAKAEQCYVAAIDSLAKEYPRALGDDHVPIGG
jgi:hypothetical protein